MAHLRQGRRNRLRVAVLPSKTSTATWQPARIGANPKPTCSLPACRPANAPAWPPGTGGPRSTWTSRRRAPTARPPDAVAPALVRSPPPAGAESRPRRDRLRPPGAGHTSLSVLVRVPPPAPGPWPASSAAPSRRWTISATTEARAVEVLARAPVRGPPATLPGCGGHMAMRPTAHNLQLPAPSRRRPRHAPPEHLLQGVDPLAGPIAQIRQGAILDRAPLAEPSCAGGSRVGDGSFGHHGDVHAFIIAIFSRNVKHIHDYIIRCTSLLSLPTPPTRLLPRGGTSD